MSENKTIAKNTFFLYFRMLMTMGVGLFSSRIVLNALGVVDYGIYSLVGGVVAVFSFFNAAMTSATQRYLAFDIGKGDFENLKKTFNATVNIHFIIAVVILLLSETLGLWFVNSRLNFPESRASAVQWCYQFSVFTLLLGVVQIPYTAILTAREHMKVYAYMSILETVLKLLIIYLLLILDDTDKLILYSFLVFTVSFIIRMLYRIYCKKKFEETKYSFYYDSSFYKELAYYSGWNLFGNIASVARIQGNNIILNLFFGPIVNAAYGITSTLQGVLVSFVGNFQMAVNPQIVKSYAAGNPERTIELVNKGAKFSFFAMLLITSPILYDVEFWLKFWLGNVPDYTLSFVFLCLCNTLLDTISNPIMMGIQATGKIRQYQIVVGILVFLNLPVSYIMLLLTNNADIVFWVSIIISCIALYFRLYFLKKIIKFNIAHFVKDVLLKIIGVVVLILVILFGLKFAFQGISDLFAVLLQAAIVVMVNFGAIYFLGITMSERAFIKTIILQKIRKK